MLTALAKSAASSWMEDLAEYVMESVIQGHHVYKTIWEPRVGEQLVLEREDSNSCDRYAVSVMKYGTIVGHVPRELSRTYWYFIRRGGTISCEVTGNRKRGVGLEVPCVYKLAGGEKLV